MEIKNNSEFDEKIDQFLKCDKESIVVDVDCHDHHEYEPKNIWMENSNRRDVSLHR